MVDDAAVRRMLHPDHPLVEILPPADDTPGQMLRDVREGMITLTALIQEGDQGLRDALGEQQEAWQTAIQTLREDVAQLRNALTARSKRRWWPW
jgi:hypothetical protein